MGREGGGKSFHTITVGTWFAGGGWLEKHHFAGGPPAPRRAVEARCAAKRW